MRARKVKISGQQRHGTISGLWLGNPHGFGTEYALTADKVEFDFAPPSIAQNVVVINNLLIDTPQVNFIRGEHGSNFDAIKHSIEHYGGGDLTKEDEKSTEKKIIVDNLVIRNATVSYDGKTDISLANIELHSIGRNTSGTSSAQVVNAIIGELITQMNLAAPKTADDTKATKKRIKNRHKN